MKKEIEVNESRVCPDCGHSEAAFDVDLGRCRFYLPDSTDSLTFCGHKCNFTSDNSIESPQAPERIWLPSFKSFSFSRRPYSPVRINNDDVEYIRADIAHASVMQMQAAFDEKRAELTANVETHCAKIHCLWKPGHEGSVRLRRRLEEWVTQVMSKIK